MSSDPTAKRVASRYKGSRFLVTYDSGDGSVQARLAEWGGLRVSNSAYLLERRTSLKELQTELEELLKKSDDRLTVFELKAPVLFESHEPEVRKWLEDRFS